MSVCPEFGILHLIWSSLMYVFLSGVWYNSGFGRLGCMTFPSGVWYNSGFGRFRCMSFCPEFGITLDFDVLGVCLSVQSLVTKSSVIPNSGQTDIRLRRPKQVLYQTLDRRTYGQSKCYTQTLDIQTYDQDDQIKCYTKLWTERHTPKTSKSSVIPNSGQKDIHLKRPNPELYHTPDGKVIHPRRPNPELYHTPDRKTYIKDDQIKCKIHTPYRKLNRNFCLIYNIKVILLDQGGSYDVPMMLLLILSVFITVAGERLAAFDILYWLPNKDMLMFYICSADVAPNGFCTEQPFVRILTRNIDITRRQLNMFRRKLRSLGVSLDSLSVVNPRENRKFILGI